MNSYRIDTFKMENQYWKAVAYQCGRYIGEAVAKTEGSAIIVVSAKIAVELGEK